MVIIEAGCEHLGITAHEHGGVIVGINAITYVHVISITIVSFNCYNSRAPLLNVDFK